MRLWSSLSVVPESQQDVRQRIRPTGRSRLPFRRSNVVPVLWEREGLCVKPYYFHESGPLRTARTAGFEPSGCQWATPVLFCPDLALRHWQTMSLRDSTPNRPHRRGRNHRPSWRLLTRKTQREFSATRSGPGSTGTPVAPGGRRSREAAAGRRLALSKKGDILLFPGKLECPLFLTLSG